MAISRSHMQQWLKVHPHSTMVSLVYIHKLLTGSGMNNITITVINIEDDLSA